jgi:endonuclease/exonuclease/phosphatase family metal-dependent hydrolase
MKIIFLNTWNGKQADAISEFLQTQKKDTDIFCLQEVYDGGMREVALKCLSDFTEIFKYERGFKDETGVDEYSQAIYIRNSIKINKSEYLFEESPESGLGISIIIEFNGKILYLLNYHGVSRPKDKLDTDARLGQSHKILNYYRSLSGPKILGGDFNFLPETESYNMFIQNGYKELVKLSNVSTTRNRLYWDNRPQKHLFSDYIFTSTDINVKNLVVPQIEISDHLPLILEIEI